jgi:hypothetical protein
MSDRDITNDDIRRVSTEIGRNIAKAIPPGVMFALLVFDGGDHGFMNYVSNADRVDMIAGLKELIANLEGRVVRDVKGSA